MSEPSSTTGPIELARMEGRTLVVAVSGEIDLHNSPALRTRLLELLTTLQPAKLVINLAKVPYMDSSGVAVLVEALRRLRKTSGTVSLVALQPRVHGIMDIARLGAVFPIVKDEAEALLK